MSEFLSFCACWFLFHCPLKRRKRPEKKGRETSRMEGLREVRKRRQVMGKCFDQHWVPSISVGYEEHLKGGFHFMTIWIWLSFVRTGHTNITFTRYSLRPEIDPWQDKKIKTPRFWTRNFLFNVHQLMENSKCFLSVTKLMTKLLC